MTHPQTPAPMPAPTPLPHPVWDLLAHYKAVAQAAWQRRAELAGPARMAHEIAFLPAALSLQETPTHPAPRRLAWAIMALFMAALLWSIVGKVDIVATAPGRIMVDERTKLIQPLETSVIKAVHVKDGDHVSKGQVLVELDPTAANADKANLQDQLASAQSEALRTATLLDLLARPDASAPAASAALLQTSAEAAVQSQLLAEWHDIRARFSKIDAEVQHRQAEINTAKASIAKLEATLPMAQLREADFKRLVEQGFMSGHATQDKTKDRIEQERDLATQRARLLETQAALNESLQTKTALRAETIRTLNDRQAQAATKVSQLQSDTRKATLRENLTQLTAPVDGVVQQLAIHSVGGVVTSAQPLMVLVPDSATVSAEVEIANQDIGFVNAKQRAEIKLETFPYTKYGTVEASVQVVSADAVTDDKKGVSYYPATLTLHQRTLWVDGKQVPISPGMAITAEIKTGKRRIIEFLSSPLERVGKESLRER
jgi:hemolysin D